MSFEAINAVWKGSRQKSGPLLVLLALADYTNSEGIAWPAVSTLARKVRMSKRNTQRCLRGLEEAGELEVRRNQGRRGSNIYRISLLESNNADAHVIGDAGVAKAVTPTSSRDDTSVPQSVSKPLKESTPVVPTGDEIDFWIEVCFECFGQAVRPIRSHVSRALCAAIPTLDKSDAVSLIEFYQTEPRDSTRPPYNSRRHSPERLIIDLPQQLALAVEVCPPPEPPRRHDYTIQEVHDYLTATYSKCYLPTSVEELDKPWLEYMRDEIENGIRERRKNRTNTGLG